LLSLVKPTYVSRGKEPLATFSELLWPLEAAAARFKAKHQRPAVLIIDGVEFLARQDPEFLETLQLFAKDAADSRKLRVVFVSNDGLTLPLMMAHSAWSRAAHPIEVGEISDADAKKYLVANGVPEEDAEHAVVHLTGGRFTALTSYVDSCKRFSNEYLLAVKDDRLLCKMLDAGVSASHALFRELVRDGGVCISRNHDLGMPQTTVDWLLAENILSMHPNNTYTFHDRHVAGWFRRQHAASWWPFA